MEKINIFAFNATQYPSNELSLWQCGFQFCESGYSFGPSKRCYFLIHYISAGEGYFYKENKTYHLQKGDMFLITPNEITTYAADLKNPWTYKWFAFIGTLSDSLLYECNLSADNPVLHNCENVEPVLDELYKADNSKHNFYLFATAQLYLLFSKISQYSAVKLSQSQTLLAKAQDYINSNLMQNINITSLAKNLFIDRSYLFKIFKKHLGISPTEYLLDAKLHKAAQLLENTSLSVNQISDSIGFNNCSIFCSYFKRKYATTPLSYRKNYF